jgi:GntR family transcriptional regulator, arabinose operon transcriptional repressor
MTKQNTGTIEILSLANQAASRLREEIRGGKYAVGQRLMDEHALARQFGISRGTVRQALKVLREERLIVRQQGRGTFVTNPTCGPLVDTKTALLGIMVYEKEYYFGKVIHGASSRAASRGFMLVTGSNTTSGEESLCTDAFLRSAVRGVAITPQVHGTMENYDRLLEAHIPLVLLDRILPDRQEDFVSVDDYQGTYMAARYLIGLGHTKLAYLGHTYVGDFPSQPKRLQGFIDACEQARLPVPPSWQVIANEESYPALLDEVLATSERPTAFVAFNDAYAIRVINAAKKRQIKVPEELSVIGFDNSALSQDYDIPLTSVHPEYDEIGKVLADMLIDKIEASGPRPKRSILITPRLVVRKSTAPPPAGR